MENWYKMLISQIRRVTVETNALDINSSDRPFFWIKIALIFEVGETKRQVTVIFSTDITFIFEQNSVVSCWCSIFKIVTFKDNWTKENVMLRQVHKKLRSNKNFVSCEPMQFWWKSHAMHYWIWFNKVLKLHHFLLVVFYPFICSNWKTNW